MQEQLKLIFQGFLSHVNVRLCVVRTSQRSTFVVVFFKSVLIITFMQGTDSAFNINTSRHVNELTAEENIGSRCSQQPRTAGQ